MTESILVGDSRGIYDAVHNKETMGIGLNDARTGVEVLHVKNNIGHDKRQHVRWAPSDLNLSDGLTKDSSEARKPFALWQARRTWVIRHDDDFMSARKRQKLRATEEKTGKGESQELEYFDLAGDPDEEDFSTW